MHDIRLTGLFCQAFLFCVCESLAGRRFSGQLEAGAVCALLVRGRVVVTARQHWLLDRLHQYIADALLRTALPGPAWGVSAIRSVDW